MNKDSLWQLLLLCLVCSCAALFVYYLPSVKLLEQTTNKLVFRLRPTFGWNIGVGFGGFGIILLVYSAYTIRFIFVFPSLLIMALSPLITCTFDRERDRMTIKRKNWLGEKIREHSINEILDVKIDELTSKYGSSYRVTLTLSSKEIPLTRIYSLEFEEAQEIANLIKNFINLNSSCTDS